MCCYFDVYVIIDFVVDCVLGCIVGWEFDWVEEGCGVFIFNCEGLWFEF